MDSPTSRLVIPVNDLTTNGGELEIFKPNGAIIVNLYYIFEQL